MVNNFVSVIIPARNEEKMIEQCLKSVRELKYPEDRFEVIVVDNGSTDRTTEIAREYGASVIVQSEGTISMLRNLGVKKAKGDIIAFIDADCIADNLWLSKVPEYFKNDEIGAVGSYPAIPANATWVQKTWYLLKDIKPDIYNAEWLPSMNLIVKRKVFEEMQGFDETLITCEDVDLCYRISGKYKIISDKAIKVVHMGEADTIGAFFVKERWRGTSNLKGILKHGLYLREIRSIVDSIYYLFCWMLLGLTCIWFLYSGDSIPVLTVLFAFVLPILFLSFLISLKSSKPGNILLLPIVLGVYFSARAFALIAKGERRSD